MFKTTFLPLVRKKQCVSTTTIGGERFYSYSWLMMDGLYTTAVPGTPWRYKYDCYNGIIVTSIPRLQAIHTYTIHCTQICQRVIDKVNGLRWLLLVRMLARKGSLTAARVGRWTVRSSDAGKESTERAGRQRCTNTWGGSVQNSSSIVFTHPPEDLKQKK